MQHSAPAPNRAPFGFVSVSTSGSKGVQLMKQVSVCHPILPFQYPQADRRGCNSHILLLLNNFISSFSIHKRIEGGATSVIAWIVAFIVMFQYPQADRRGCNALAGRRGGHPLRSVSVSTSGSKGVQLLRITSVICNPSVSVSTSGSKGVQPWRWSCSPERRCVSVSTSGSKGVQP